MTGSPRATNGRWRDQLAQDDHDLLTFGAVGERLRVEIGHAEADLDVMTLAGDQPGIAKAAARLAALRDAAQRNGEESINDANFENFFGYPGNAKRHLGSSKTEG